MMHMVKKASNKEVVVVAEPDSVASQPSSRASEDEAAVASLSNKQMTYSRTSSAEETPSLTFLTTILSAE